MGATVCDANPAPPPNPTPHVQDFLLPASYYLSTLFEREPTPAARFEQAVLAAVNSGGNNMWVWCRRLCCR